jgi:copper chaperone
MITPSSISFSIAVENIKCGGCASGIVTKLSALPNVSHVLVDVAAGLVTVNLSATIEAEFEAQRQAVLAQLTTMGYPPVGTLDGLPAMGAKAKSFVSCAIGKIGQK